MGNTFIDEKEKFPLHISNSSGPVNIQVNTTILTWCIDLRDNNIINSISDDSKEKLKNAKQGVVNVAVLDQSNNAIKDKCTCIMQDDNILRINLSQNLRLALQRIFPISSAIAICKKKRSKFPVDLKSILSELIQITPVISESVLNSGFVLKAAKVCTSGQLKNNSLELGLLSELVEKFMTSGAFAVTAQNGKRNHGHNDNTIVSSIPWKSANEYGEVEKALTNCIYYLSNEDT